MSRAHTPAETRSSADARRAVAIVGIGCRFPGGVTGPDSYWELLRDAVDAIREIPESRFDVAALYDPEPGTPGRMAVREGGFLEGLDRFDAAFFGIAPREMARVDPQQRLLLEVAWEAVEDAGCAASSLAGTRTGVFVGSCASDYEDLQVGHLDQFDVYTITGGSRSTLSGRVSFALDLRGPSVSVDTACSSSLVAVHLAVKSLRDGESELALAGGVNVILQPEWTIGFSQAGMLAPDGRCKFGDARANGFVRSEGCGLLALKRLEDALASGDRIHGVIRGSAVGNDGRSSGLLMTPGEGGQLEAARAAYRDAGVDTGRVRYIEAHGTGTRAGDPVELRALGGLLGHRDRPCFIGSAKTNIGHTEGAAGVAGLIKAVLSLRHGVVPPSLHFRDPSPDIPWDEIPLRIPTEPVELGHGDPPHVAGVSAFGLSGTNAHVVLEAPPTRAAASEAIASARPRLIPLSARSPEARDALVEAWRARLDSGAESLDDLAYSAGLRRDHHEHRLAVVASSRAELLEGLAAGRSGRPSAGLSLGRASSGPRLRVFVFPGQGSQWSGMGLELYAHVRSFRQALEAVDEAIRREAGWSVIDELRAEEASSRLDETDRAQPAILALQVALTATWRAFGIEPDAVVGHSLGEVAAAYVAGALDLEDAVRVICRRSRLVATASGRGSMAVVELGFEEAERLVAARSAELSVAAGNGPSTSIVSGTVEAVEELRDELERRDVFCRLVKVDYASHSPQMDPLTPRLEQELAAVRPRSSRIPIYSTVTGAVQDGERFDARYWGRNLRVPVRFWEAVQGLLADGHLDFIEVSPHPVLLPPLREDLRAGAPTRDAEVHASLRRGEDERAALLGALASLYTSGHSVDFAALDEGRGRFVSLPTYPWQRESYWLEEFAEGSRAGGGRGSAVHPLLALELHSSVHDGTHFFETTLDLKRLRYLEDHRVGDRIVLPAAAYTEMARAAGEELLGAGGFEVEELRFEEAVTIAPENPLAVQLAVSPEVHGRLQLRFLSRQGRDEPWVRRASGSLSLLEGGVSSDPTPLDADEIRARCPREISAEAHYAELAERALPYGRCFQGVSEIVAGDGEALGGIRLPDALRAEAGRYGIHPALLDACFQVLTAALPEEWADAVFVPAELGRFRLYRSPGRELYCHAAARPSDASSGDSLVFELTGFDAEGERIFEAEGLRIEPLDRRADTLESWLHALEWRREERPDETARLEARAVLLIGEGALTEALGRALEAGGARAARAVPRTGSDAAQAAGTGQLAFDPGDPESVNRLLSEAFPEPGERAVLHVLDAERPEDAEPSLDSLWAGQEHGLRSALHVAQALASRDDESPPRLWLVTAGTQAVGEPSEWGRVGGTTLFGFGRSVRQEHPELRCARLDLPRDFDPTEAAAAVAGEVALDPDEDEIALRRGGRYVHRLVRYQAGADREPERAPVGAADYMLEMPEPGPLDRLRLREIERPEPGRGEVEVEVHSVGLNFRDVLLSMGVIPWKQEISLGWECSGVITRAGEGVDGIGVGDPVIGLSLHSFKRHAIVRADCTIPKPAHWSFEQGATIAGAFVTARWALHSVGRMRRGERALIHSAAGGVGLAAVQLCQRAGVEVFATAGTPEKRKYLRSLGVQHVMDSHSLAFADEVMEATGGEGVDLVLNSLAGQAIPRSLSTLRNHGRFLEIGKRDIAEDSRLALALLARNVSFHVIDLDVVMRFEPHRVGEHLREVFEKDAPDPLHCHCFPLSRVEEAFRFMTTGRHIGKIVVDVRDVSELQMVPRTRSKASLRRDGTYLITGGLGGLGLEIARWMAASGAGRLVLLGRRGLSPAVEPDVKDLRAAGVAVRVDAVDVAEEERVAELLASVRADGPPLRGVVHAAGLLDDGVLAELTWPQFERVFAPKVAGAWNLHRHTAADPLDFFVLFSSAATLIGSPGQANYAAANAFMDALASRRRAEGRAAQSVNWGPWAAVGLAAAQENRGGRLSLRGIPSLSVEEGVGAFAALLDVDEPQLGVVRFDLDEWCRTYPRARDFALFRELRRSPAAEAGYPLRSELLALESIEAREALLDQRMREHVAHVIQTDPGRLDPDQPFGSAGLDSLMTVELRNRLQADLGVPLSSTALFNYPTLTELSGHLAERLSLNVSPETRDEPGPVDLDVAVGDDALSAMSEEEAQEKLIQTLDALEARGE